MDYGSILDGIDVTAGWEQKEQINSSKLLVQTIIGIISNGAVVNKQSKNKI